MKNVPVGRIPAKEAEELVTDQVLNILQKARDNFSDN